MKKIAILTRCSRPDYLERIRENICSVLYDIPFQWVIVFDMNRMQTDQKLLKWLETWSKKMDIVYSFSGSNDLLYGSNLANEAYHLASPDCDWFYLLDDDNALHKHFADVIRNHCHKEQIIYVPQLRKDRETETIKTFYITEEMKDYNCVGLVDSAQFLLPKSILGVGYEDGYCIDGFTIRRILQENSSIPQVYVNDQVAAYYNYWTELR